MAYVEVRKDGKLVLQRLVADEEAQKGCNIRLGAEGSAKLCIGESRQVGKYHVAMYEGQPSEDGFKAVEDLEKAAKSIHPVDQNDAGPAPQDNARPRRPQIDNFEITGRLGEGGMGTVWRGIQLSTKREVAIKFMGSHRFASKKMQARFEREVALAAKLNHPNIASVYDSGVHRGVYYYAMELIDGVHLDKYVYKNELNDHQIILLMDEICDAMRHAHEKGIIHRDLKPSNILVTKEGKPYIVDFGLAKASQKEDQDVTISISGEIAGTPAYMAPEQAAGRISEIGPHTDVYALGIIFYHLVTGQYPHKMYGSRYDVMKSIIEDEVLPPRNHKPGINRDLESIIMKALAKKPEDRYATAGQMTEDIENLLSGKSLAAKSMSSTYMLQRRMNKLRKPTLLAAISILVLMLVFFTAYHFGKLGNSSPSVSNEQDEKAVNRITDNYFGIFSLSNENVRDELETICADEMVANLADGRVFNGKQEVIDGYNKELDNIKSMLTEINIIFQRQSVNVSSQTAEILGKIQLLGTRKKDNSSFTREVWVTLKFKKIGDQWLMTQEQAALSEQKVSPPAATAFRLSPNAASIPQTSEPGKIIYVSTGATGSNTGQNWKDAYTDLQKALQAADKETAIWVAKGVYHPDSNTGSRKMAFQLKKEVAVYGGFSGIENDLNQRNIAANPTVLSGDLKGDDLPDFTNMDENSYHVVTASDTDNTAVLNGFTITGGNANGPGPLGMDDMFGRYQFNDGGGLYNRSNGSPTLMNCSFIQNSASDVGGAIYNIKNSAPRIVNCYFERNRANAGHTIFNRNASPVFEKCHFRWSKDSGFDNEIRSVLKSDPRFIDCQYEYNLPASATANQNSSGKSRRDPIVGQWSWFSGYTMTMDEAGTINSDNANRWNCLDTEKRLYKLSWQSGFTDTLTLSADGNRLSGNNQKGAEVSGTRLNAANQSGNVPAPAAHWKLDGDSNVKVVDELGRHHGAIQGLAKRVPGISGNALGFSGNGCVRFDDVAELRSRKAFTWTAWIKTTKGGPIIGRTGIADSWQNGGKVLFVEEGTLTLDIGWVGRVKSNSKINDGKWHHSAVTAENSQVRFYLDGELDGGGVLRISDVDESRLPVKIGYCNHNFPNNGQGFTGVIDDVRWYNSALDENTIKAVMNMSNSGQISPEQPKIIPDDLKSLTSSMSQRTTPPQAIQINGKPFFVICARSAVIDEFAEYKQAGFNTVYTHLPSSPALDEAQKQGLYAIPCFAYYKQKDGIYLPEFWKEARQYITAWKSHPALLAWSQAASMDYIGIDPSEIKNTFDLLGTEAPGKLRLLAYNYNDNNWTKLYRFNDFADIIVLENYSIRKNPSATALWFQHAFELAKGRPVWYMVHANICENMIPSVRELRAAVYLGVNHGATGILIDGFQNRLWKEWGVDVPGLADPRLAGLRREAIRIAGELKTLSQAILAGSLKDADKFPGNSLIDFQAFSDPQNSTLYLIAVNPSNQLVTSSFHVSHEIINPIEALNEHRTLEQNNGTFTDTFEQNETHIYICRSSPNQIENAAGRISAKQLKTMQNEWTGSIVGIGVELEKIDKGLLIKRVIAEPAKRAGLILGDIITLVGETKTTDIPLEDAIGLIKGPEGSIVKLGILSPDGQTKTVEVIRSKVIVNNVNSTILQNNISLLKISAFNNETCNGIIDALDNYSNHGIKGMILDLRGNQGGLYQEVIKTAGLFISSRKILWFTKKENESLEAVYSKEDAQCNLPLVILVDEKTLSGGELLAAAMKRSGRGKLIGHTTSGTAAIKKIIEHPDGSADRVKVADFYYDSTTPITDRGITPDIPLPQSASSDEYIKKAVEVLTGQ
jgi:C-terminal peptidase prc